MHTSKTVPLHAYNGRKPGYPQTDMVYPDRDTYIFSDNHLTGAVHSGHVIPASTSPGSLSCMDLATLPIIDILRFNSLPSLYIP
ncbi:MULTISPECIES: hypothetical protein [Paenibacillus]|uniref:hypothetical protein n=1 Tax=Paenibacillus sp. FSL H8-0283 TaxID=2921383 RepID=UPI0013E386A7|nr:hypothetical protein [Paenibacillus amylolyticus]